MHSTLQPEPQARTTNPWAERSWVRALAAGVGLPAIYLLVFRGISFLPHFWKDHEGGAVLMSFAFLVLAPLIAGMLTIYRFDPRHQPGSWVEWIFTPWIAIVLNLALALNVHWEGWICAIFILPPAFAFASLGGVLAGLFNRSRHRHIQPTTMACLALVPMLLAMMEPSFHQPLQTRTVSTQIRIGAPAVIVWSQIKRVPAIRPAELRRSWANAIGFPRPVEATLSYEGVGGVRNASFERGLNFVETVDTWEPNRRIGFSIKADTAAIPSTTLDEHVSVGGRFFDVLHGEYEIEPSTDGAVILHLASHQRLSTDFNLYTAMWSDAVMSDMQNNILHVIQQRCEQQMRESHRASAQTF